MRRTWLILLALVLLVGCGKKKRYVPHEPDDKPVAKVYGKYLYLSEVEAVVPNGISPDDSVSYAQTFINSWVEKELMAHVALQFLDKQQIDEINRKVEDFKNSLLIHAFKQQLIAEKLDTNVSLDIISQYYETHKADFVLSQPAIRGFWFKVPLSSENLAEIRNLAFSDTEEDFLVLKDLVIKSGGTFHDFRYTWNYFSDVIVKIPFVVSDPDYFVKARRYLQTQDDFYYYFLRITEYRQKGDYIPLSLCQDDIKRIILNRRSEQLIGAIEQKLYDQAVSKGDIKIFQ